MAVRVLALAFVVAQIVAGGKIRLHGNFIHCCLLDPARTKPLHSTILSGSWLFRLAHCRCAVASCDGAPLRCAGPPARKVVITPISADASAASSRINATVRHSVPLAGKPAESSTAPAPCLRRRERKTRAWQRECRSCGTYADGQAASPGLKRFYSEESRDLPSCFRSDAVELGVLRRGEYAAPQPPCSSQSRGKSRDTRYEACGRRAHAASRRASCVSGPDVRLSFKVKNGLL